jgi:hypothetical protein
LKSMAKYQLPQRLTAALKKSQKLSMKTLPVLHRKS